MTSSKALVGDLAVTVSLNSLSEMRMLFSSQVLGDNYSGLFVI
ncbi:hypothetical protein [Serratia symbiotica]|nr:hypothetical protein [Serratia symbiotica]